MAAYTIIKSDGTVLTTIPEGTINTTASTIALPGKNFSGYGLYIDTNIVRMTEHFAATSVPANPMRGQLWYDLGNLVMKYCPTNGESNGANWISFAGQGGSANFTDLNVTGNITGGNATFSGSVDANAINASYGNIGNLIVPGTSTFGGDATFNSNVSVTGNLEMNGSNISDVDVITANLANIEGANLNGGNIGNANVITANTFTGGNFTGIFQAPGSNTQILFNDGGNIGADAGLTYNKLTDTITSTNFIANTTANLGAIANVTITGGSSGQSMLTNGAGVLTWSFADRIANGTSNVSVPTSGGNVQVAVGGTSNVFNVHTGGADINGNVLATGNMVVNGTLTYVNTTTLQVVDPIITMGGGPNGTPLTSNDGKDRGTELKYYSGSAKSAFMGWDNSAGNFIFYSDATIVNEVVTGGTLGNLTMGNINAQGLTLPGGSPMTTTNITTGAAATPGTITGTWTLTPGSTLQATYADLAERHHADAEYSEGTIVKVGGENEITQTTDKSDLLNVLGVVSKKYAYLMNAEAGPDATHPAVAYVGRVPVRVIGPIRKGDKVTPLSNGCATASMAGTGFGWALENNDSAEEKLVLCVIK